MYGIELNCEDGRMVLCETGGFAFLEDPLLVVEKFPTKEEAEETVKELNLQHNSMKDHVDNPHMYFRVFELTEEDMRRGQDIDDLGCCPKCGSKSDPIFGAGFPGESFCMCPDCGYVEADIEEPTENMI